MSSTDRLARKIESLLLRTPDGRRLVPLPWETLADAERQKLPFFARARATPGPAIFLLGVLLVTAALLGGGKIPAALGLGLATVAGRAYLTAWRRMGHLVVVRTEVPVRVHERDEFAAIVALRNTGKAASGRILLRLVFDGAARRERFAIEAPIGAGETRRIKIVYKADRGMGPFAFHPVDVVVSDDLKLFQLCARHEVEAVVDVLPEPSSGNEIEAKRASYAANAGPYEARLSGDSATFLGLRPFRTGDGMRRIDWKRTMRVGNLLVRDFERLLATEATMILDQGPGGHSGFGGLSSLESMRDAALSFARGLLGQQMRVQLIASDRSLPFGAGRSQETMIEDQIKTMRTDPTADFAALLQRNLPLVPPDSLLALFFCSRSVVLDDIWESLMVLEERRVETVMIIVDSDRFALAVKDAAKLELAQIAMVEQLKRAAGRGASEAERLVTKLVDRAYILAPGESWAEASSLGEGGKRRDRGRAQKRQAA